MPNPIYQSILDTGGGRVGKVAAAGVIGGLAFGIALVKEGAPREIDPWLGVAVGALMGVAAGLLLTLNDARPAARAQTGHESRTAGRGLLFWTMAALLLLVTSCALTTVVSSLIG